MCRLQQGQLRASVRELPLQRRLFELANRLADLVHGATSLVCLCATRDHRASCARVHLGGKTFGVRTACIKRECADESQHE